MVSGPAEFTSKEDYDRIFYINTIAPFRLTQLAIPHLRKTKGNIVNISSLAAIFGVNIIDNLRENFLVYLLFIWQKSNDVH